MFRKYIIVNFSMIAELCSCSDIYMLIQIEYDRKEKILLFCLITSLHVEDVLKGSQYGIQNCCSRNNNLLSHHKHSLTQRILFVWRLWSRKEDIAADSLESAHEDVLAFAFNGWLDNSKVDVHS